jgi:Flp pilus assembly protein TadG
MTGRHDDSGTAIIEFIFVAIIVMVPLMYLIVAVASVQRSELAVSQAAGETGRAFATAAEPGGAMARARAAVHLALHDEGLPDDALLRFVSVTGSCTGPAVVPTLAPGTQFTVCVTRHTGIPAIPRFLTGKGITTVGRYTVHIDDYRASP